VGWAFTHSHSANWHPMTWLSHMLDCQCYALNPAGHHLTSLLFHTANSVLLFLLLRFLTGAVWRSACVAAFFALHPMHLASVAWIAERKDVLSAFFGLLCLWAYAAYAKERESGASSPTSGPASRITPHGSRITPHAYLLSLAFYALGLMSKPMLVTWPFVMLLLDFWPLGRLRLSSLGRLLLEKLPFFVLAMVSSVLTFQVQKAWGGVVPIEHVPLGLRLVNLPISYFRYLCKLVWPDDLAVIYPYIRQWPRWEVLVAVLVVVGFSLLAIWQRKNRPYLLAGWAWFLGTLVPVIGLVQVGNQSIADRYAYLPAIGFFILAVWGIADLLGPGQDVAGRDAGAPRWLGVVLAKSGTAAAIALIALLVMLLPAQIMHWQNTETLFQHALKVTTNNFVAYNSLGFYFRDLRECKQAERCYRAAIIANPGGQYSWHGLASVLIDQQKYEEAAADCQVALQLDPGMAQAHATLGLALIKQSKTNEAVLHYSEALRLLPDYAPAHYNLANALAAQGKFEQAREHYQASLRSDPDSADAADARNNLAYILARDGRFDQAISEFRAALAQRPRLWQAHFGLGDVLLRQGKYDQAADAFSEALRLKADQALPHCQLALALSRQGKTKSAIEHYREALRLAPDFAAALNRLAWILATDPDPQIRHGTEAVELAERACKGTDYKQPIMLQTLAAAYAETGRYADAISALEKAQPLLPSQGQSELAHRNRELLELFRAGHPYREVFR